MVQRLEPGICRKQHIKWRDIRHHCRFVPVQFFTDMIRIPRVRNQNLGPAQKNEISIGEHSGDMEKRKACKSNTFARLHAKPCLEDQEVGNGISMTQHCALWYPSSAACILKIGNVIGSEVNIRIFSGKKPGLNNLIKEVDGFAVQEGYFPLGDLTQQFTEDPLNSREKSADACSNNGLEISQMGCNRRKFFFKQCIEGNQHFGLRVFKLVFQLLG